MDGRLTLSFLPPPPTTQGLVLETAWHALEDAGIEPSSLSGRTVGVYIGAISHEFAVLESLRGESSTWAATGVSNSLVAEPPLLPAQRPRARPSPSTRPAPPPWWR